MREYRLESPTVYNTYTCSIIIPHKGVPDLLMRCLHSIPVRPDIQVIVVDDNSPDADTYLDKYPELSRPYLSFYRTTEGRGAGFARNYGIEKSEGTWLLFADADDLFVSENLAHLISLAAESSYQVICWPVLHKRRDSTEGPYLLPLSSELGTILPRKTAGILEDCKEKDLLFRMWQPWFKMCKRDFIITQKIAFSEIAVCNDLRFSLLVAKWATCIGQYSDYIYKYIQRAESLSFVNLPETRNREIHRCYLEMKELGKERYLADLQGYCTLSYLSNGKRIRFLKAVGEMEKAEFARFYKKAFLGTNTLGSIYLGFMIMLGRRIPFYRFKHAEKRL